MTSMGINRFIFLMTSTIIVNWSLGIGLLENEGIYCDKIERWSNCKFFCQNNTLFYKENTSNILLIVSNLYRMYDVESGQEIDDFIKIIVNEIYKNIPLPKKIYSIVQVGDNASESLSKKLNNTCKSLGISIVEIPVRVITDPDPIKQEIYGGLFEFIDESSGLLNSWIKDLNTTNETTGISVIVTGSEGDAFTNTMLNTNLNLNNLDSGLPVNATLYQILEDTTLPVSFFGGNPLYLNSRNIRNKFLGTNYIYSELNVSVSAPKPKIPTLPIDQYNTIYSTKTVFNPILTKVNGYLPDSINYNLTLAIIETIEYILAESIGEINAFNGAQDNRFRFDLLTQRSRVSALLEYLYYPANSFDPVSNGLRTNKNSLP